MRVEIATQAWGVVQDRAGNTRANLPFTITTVGGGAVTRYAAAAGATTNTATQTNANGEIPGFIEDGTYIVSVGGVTKRVEAVFAGDFDSLPVNVLDFGATGDGVTDDNDEIAAAIAAAAAAGRPVYAPSGTYLIRGLGIPSDTVIFGDGPTTVFKTDPATVYAFTNDDEPNGNENITLRDFAIDGNKANIAGDPEVAGNPAAAIYIAAVGPNTVENITIERLHVFNSKRLGIVLSNARRFAVRDNIVENNDRDGITIFFSSQDGLISGNRVTACGDDYIALNTELLASTGHTLNNIVITDNVLRGPGQRSKGKGIMMRGGEGVVIANNVITDVSEHGIKIADANTTPVADVVISGNVVRRPSNDAIKLHAGELGEHSSGGYSSIRDVTISDNVVDDPTDAGIAMRSDHGSNELYGIKVNDNHVRLATWGITTSGAAAIRDVTVTANTVVGSSVSGIAMGPGVNNLHVVSNSVRNGTGAGVEAGIRVDASTNVAIFGNVCYDNQTVPTQQYGIRLFNLMGTCRVGPNLAFGNVVKQIDLSIVGSPTLREGFYGTEPIAKPTGVAVTAAGVHAALVSLGLIAP